MIIKIKDHSFRKLTAAEVVDIDRTHVLGPRIISKVNHYYECINCGLVIFKFIDGDTFYISGVDDDSDAEFPERIACDEKILKEALE